MKTIGLIAGMSWESSAHYYSILNQETAQRLGGLSSAKIAMYSVEFSELARCMHEGDWDRVQAVLIDAARRVERAGADVILICTNTMHALYDRIRASVDTPMIHIVDPVIQAARERNFSTVGLLGTSFTMEQPFFRDRLKAAGVDCLIPDDAERSMIHSVIFEELCKGVTTQKSARDYLGVIEKMKAQGAQAVILGCTEIAMLVKEEDSPLPLLDTTRLHALAAVDFALS